MFIICEFFCGDEYRDEISKYTRAYLTLTRKREKSRWLHERRGRRRERGREGRAWIRRSDVRSIRARETRRVFRARTRRGNSRPCSVIHHLLSMPVPWQAPRAKPIHAFHSGDFTRTRHFSSHGVAASSFSDTKRIPTYRCRPAPPPATRPWKRSSSHVYPDDNEKAHSSSDVVSDISRSRFASPPN